MKAMTSFSEPASAITASAVPPALRTCSTVSLTPSVRSTAISFAPSLVNSSDAARPMPLPAPVMMTDLPSRRPMAVSLIKLKRIAAFSPCGIFKQDLKRRSDLRRRVLSRTTRDSIEGSFAMSNPDKPAVVTTRWWWVRHAPVRSDGGNIYGQKDIACDTSDREVFEAVAKILPRRAVWYASSLMRTHQTAEAIWDTGFPRPATMTQGGGLRRTASRTMAGDESRRVSRQPAGRQPLVCRYRRARAGRREFHGSLQPRLSRDRSHQCRTGRQGRDRGRLMAARSRRRSVLRSAASRKRASPSISTIVR